MDVLTGQFIKKIYSTSNGRYHVYKFSNQGKSCIVTLTGTTTPDLTGIHVLSGRWVINPKYGPQFETVKLNRYQTNQERGNDYIKQIKGMLVA